MAAPDTLQRFVDAQASIYADVVRELTAGKKRSHWMWFVFPQIAGLGFSSMSMRFAIASLDEAKAYLAHPLLGARLVECTRLVVAIDGRSLRQIFGEPDDAKFRSSMTLFAHASPVTPEFSAALAKHCDGRFDPMTVARLGDGVRESANAPDFGEG